MNQNYQVGRHGIGDTGMVDIQEPLDGKMVEGFSVDDQMDKHDCMACTEAKQHIKSSPKKAYRQTEPGELTHIDLWGKYTI